jgi:hypothetical protein
MTEWVKNSIIFMRLASLIQRKVVYISFQNYLDFVPYDYRLDSWIKGALSMTKRTHLKRNDYV